MLTTIRERLNLIREERSNFVHDNAYRTVEEHHEYITTDAEASFKVHDDFAYYERLTGHIEELQYLERLAAPDTNARPLLPNG